MAAAPKKIKNPIYTLLHNTELGTLVEDRDIFTLKISNTVEDAIKLLASKHIHSCPVLDKNGKALVGMIDVAAIIAYVQSVAPTKKDLDRDALSKLEIAGRAIALVPLERIVETGETLLPLYPSSPASMACELLASSSMHHAVIQRPKDAPEDPKASIVHNVLAQSDLLKFLAANIERGECKALASKTLKELGLGQGGCVAATADMTVLRCLRRIRNKGVSCLPVVADKDTQKLIGNFSSSDIIGLYREQYPDFCLSVEEFLKKFSPKSLTPRCTRLDSTLLDLVKELATEKLHHLWVVDADFRPSGIVSITDICRLIVNHKYY